MAWAVCPIHNSFRITIQYAMNRRMNFLSNFYDGFLPKKSIITWWSILKNHRAFFSDYLEGRRDKHEKPASFLFVTLSVYFLISSVGSYFITPTWVDAIIDMNTNQIEYFENVFNIKLNKDTIYREMLIAGSSNASKSIKSKVGSIKLEKISEYLSNIGEYKFALVMLKSKDRKTSIINYIIFFIQIIIPILFIFQSRIIHEFLAGTEITKEESLDVYVYIIAFMYPFLALIETVTWIYVENEMIVSYMRYFLVFLAIWKVGDSYAHIYNENIFKSYLIVVFSTTIVVVPLIFLILLFALYLA